MATLQSFSSVAAPEMRRLSLKLLAQSLHAFGQCDDPIQSAIREMAEIVVAESSDEDEVEAALATMTELLFPRSRRAEELGLDHIDDQEELAQGKMMEQEQATFAENLATFMAQKTITQSELAQRIGVGQPAIAMLLGRDARPQRKTVEKIAAALGVPTDSLWPGLKASDR